MIDKGVYGEYETYLNNKNNTEIKYAHIDSVNIFKLIEFILAQPRNNPVQHFDRYTEIESWLREQWAGLFRELISRMSNQTQLTTLSAKIDELGEVNETLKTYLEKLVTEVSPESSAELIESETERLADKEKIAKIGLNVLIRDLNNLINSPDTVYRLLINSQSDRKFIEDIIEAQDRPEVTMKNIDCFGWDFINQMLNEARESIGMNPLKQYVSAKQNKNKDIM